MTPERIAEIKPLLNGRRRLAALSVAKELLAAVESLQAENARLRAALVAARNEVDDRVPAFRNDKVLAAIDAALEESR